MKDLNQHLALKTTLEASDSERFYYFCLGFPSSRFLGRLLIRTCLLQPLLMQNSVITMAIAVTDLSEKSQMKRHVVLVLRPLLD